MLVPHLLKIYFGLGWPSSVLEIVSVRKIVELSLRGSASSCYSFKLVKALGSMQEVQLKFTEVIYSSVTCLTKVNCTQDWNLKSFQSLLLLLKSYWNKKKPNMFSFLIFLSKIKPGGATRSQSWTSNVACLWPGRLLRFCNEDMMKEMVRIQPIIR